jgi:hypothetical protein
MSHYVSPYAYRLPPDTFLSRRDPNWYIGATPTPEQQTEIKRWSDAIASLQQSEAAIMVQAQAATDAKAKMALLQQVIPQLQQQIQFALEKLQAAQKAAGVKIAMPTSESFAQLEALVLKAREDFEKNASAWISEMRGVVGRLAPDYVTSMQGLVDNVRRTVFEGSVPRLMLRVKSGEIGKQKDIERLLKISAEAIKSQYEETAKSFRDMGPVSTLAFRMTSGLVQAAEAIGRYVLQMAVQMVKEIIKTAQEEATKNPLGFALVTGGAFAALALYLYIKKS